MLFIVPCEGKVVNVLNSFETNLFWTPFLIPIYHTGTIGYGTMWLYGTCTTLLQIGPKVHIRPAPGKSWFSVGLRECGKHLECNNGTEGMCQCFHQCWNNDFVASTLVIRRSNKAYFCWHMSQTTKAFWRQICNNNHNTCLITMKMSAVELPAQDTYLHHTSSCCNIAIERGIIILLSPPVYPIKIRCIWNPEIVVSKP